MDSRSSFLLQNIIKAQREKNYKAPEAEQQIIDTLLSQLREELEKGRFCWNKTYDTELMQLTFYPNWIHMYIMHKYGSEVKGLKAKGENLNKDVIITVLTEIGLTCEWKSRNNKKFLLIKYAYQQQEKTQ